MTSWIMPVILILTVVYNSIVTHVIAKNDIKHLAADQKEMKRDIKMLIIHLLDEKK